MSERLENGSLLLGRILLAACFIPSGVAKLSNISGLAVSLAAVGLPYPGAFATGCVLANVFGPIALLVGLAPRTTAGALIAVTAVTTALLHRFWEFGGAAALSERTIFVAHLGVIAGLLFYLVSGPGAWSWQGWWRGGSGLSRSAPDGKRTPRAPRPA